MRSKTASWSTLPLWSWSKNSPKKPRIKKYQQFYVSLASRCWKNQYWPFDSREPQAEVRQDFSRWYSWRGRNQRSSTNVRRRHAWQNHLVWNRRARWTQSLCLMKLTKSAMTSAEILPQHYSRPWIQNRITRLKIIISTFRLIFPMSYL